MKEIRNPVPMIGRSKAIFPKLPVSGQAVGFDLEKGDWVRPHGSGVHSDFIFTYTPFTNVLAGGTTIVTFSNEHDGIMDFSFGEHDQSWFKWPYEAPRNGYTNELTRFYKRYELVKSYGSLYPGRTDTYTVLKIDSNFNDDSEINYIFRVRTQVDENEHIVKACYGIISGEIGNRFTYWFNPDPTSRSLERDQRKSVLLE